MKSTAATRARLHLTSAVLGLALSASAHAAINAVNLGTGAPPSTLPGYVMHGFDQTTQSAIVDYTSVPTLPSPLGGTLGFTPSAIKATVGVSWTSWSHSYGGPVFAFIGSTTDGTSATLNLPPATQAFIFYFEGGGRTENHFVTATSNNGTILGPVAVHNTEGAIGIGFYATTAGEYITSIEVDTDDENFAVAEFSVGTPSSVAVSSQPIPTNTPGILAGLSVILAAMGVFVLRRRKAA